jgi:hypothetical protein
VNADDRVKYLQAIWTNFMQKAKTTRDMSSSEYHVAAGWASRGIPLFVVLRGIEDFSGRPRRLEAVVQSVEAARDYHFKAIGGLTELPDAGELEEPS